MTNPKALALLLVCLLAVVPPVAAESGSESGRLLELLNLGPGLTAAEIGAGDGVMTIDAARLVGDGGRVYSTEITERKVDVIKEAAEEAGLANVVPMLGGSRDTNLPAGCCDVIFMRHVYHHFTSPGEMRASLFAALRPGGRLAVIDFNPRRSYPDVDGVPHSRGGHGMPMDLLIEELTTTGFVLEHRIADWRGNDYCVVVRKPEGP